MQLEIAHIPWNSNQMHLIVSDRGHCAELEGNTYFTIDTLLAQHPELVSQQHINILAFTSNFLFAGLQFSVIEDIVGFKEKYNNGVSVRHYEKNFLEPTIAQYGIFDITCLIPPFLEKDSLIYFVESANFGIPYKAHCVLPINGREGSCSYTLLPHVTAI